MSNKQLRMILATIWFWMIPIMTILGGIEQPETTREHWVLNIIWWFIPFLIWTGGEKE